MSSTCILVLIACATAIALGDYTEGHNGRPGCKTAAESSQKFRNNFDPTKYWVCPATTTGDALEVQCESGGYVEESSSCVDWSEWEWVEPHDPPIMA